MYWRGKIHQVPKCSMNEGKGPGGGQEAATVRDVSLKGIRQTGRLAGLQRELSLLEEGPSVWRDKGKLIKKCCVPLPTVSCPLPVTQTIFVDLVEERNNVDQKFLGFMRLMHYLLR